MVNNIEVNVSNAAEYISRAKEETKKAVRYQKKSRRVSVCLSLLGRPRRVFHRLHNFFLNVLHLCTSYACLHAFETKFTFTLAEIHHHCICSVDPARGRCINRGPLCRTNQTPFMRTAKTA